MAKTNMSEELQKSWGIWLLAMITVVVEAAKTDEQKLALMRRGASDLLQNVYNSPDKKAEAVKKPVDASIILDRAAREGIEQVKASCFDLFLKNPSDEMKDAMSKAKTLKDWLAIRADNKA